MKTKHLLTTSTVALVIVAASLFAEPAHAALGFGRGGMSNMGGMSRTGGMSHMGGMSHAGGMSRMGNTSKLGGASKTGVSRASHASNAAHGSAKRGDSSAKSNDVKSNTKLADRDVGHGMKEKAGTATHDKYGNPIGGKGYDPETGRTTSSYKNGTGGHDVTVTGKDGKTISTDTTGKKGDNASTDFGGTKTSVVSNGDGTRTATRTDRDGNTTTTVAGKPPQGASEDDGKGGWKHHEPHKESSGGSLTTEDGTKIVITGVGSDDKTITRTDKDGKVDVTKNPPGPPFVPAANIFTAITNLQDAANRYAKAKAEADAARQSLISIASADQSDGVGGNLKPAIDRVAQADANLNSATRDVQRAINDYSQQSAQLGR